METCKLTHLECKYAPFNPDTDECYTCIDRLQKVEGEIRSHPQEYEEVNKVLEDHDKWTILRRLAAIDPRLNIDRVYASETLHDIEDMIISGEYRDLDAITDEMMIRYMKIGHMNKTWDSDLHDSAKRNPVEDSKLYANEGFHKESCDARCPYYCDTDSVDINSLYPKTLFDTRAIKPEKYAELREQDFDTWLDTILHEIIERVNLDAHSAKLELLDDKIHHLKDLFEDIENQINDLSIRFDEFKKFVGYTLADPTVSPHTCSNFCGNCSHYQAPTSAATLPTCKLSGEIIDPDDSSCTMFEPPF